MVDDPLYDAVGHAITPASVRAASAEREGRARIGRDRDGGVEGASHEFTREAVFELIRKKEAEGCVFTYPGADQDAYAVGGSIGVHAAATQDFAGDGAGTRAVFSSVSAAVLDPRTGTWCLVRLGQEEPGGRENVLRDVVLCTLLFVSAGGASDADAQVRLAAFRFLDDLQLTYEQGVPRRALERGFDFAGTRVPLVGPRGIFKPAILSELPLSITTKPIVEGQDRPYEDEWTEDGLVRYRYEGTEPRHFSNVGLRRAMADEVPLVYFAGIVPGWYLPAYPAFVVRDEPDALTFTVAVDKTLADTGQQPYVEDPMPRRAYVTREVRQRLHQAGFRQRVIRAYREMCAVCRLRHRELLDAAHILPDWDPRSEPVVPNGLALCRLHHAAFDGHIIGIRPDLVIEVRPDVLREIDGPMLIHGLQGFQGAELFVPRTDAHKPNRDHLAARYEQFRTAS